MLSEPILALLQGLPFRSEAKRMVSLIPLGSIYWDDEMPEYADLMRLSEDEQQILWRLFAIRFRVWDGEPLSGEDRDLWEAARSEVPIWALFHRLVLSAEDQVARQETERGVQKEFEELFGEADQVEVTDEGHGLQSFSATFDLMKGSPKRTNS